MRKYLRNLFLFQLLLSAAFGCIPNKKVVYLQDKSKVKSQDYENNLSVASPYREYKLQPEDIVSIQISKLPTVERIYADPIEITNNSRTQIMHPYLTGFPIDDRGNVDIPTIGIVNIGGLTLDEAQQKLTKIAFENYSLPSVRIFLMNFNVTVLGEVLHPGRYPVYTSRLNILEALGLAGDCSDFANKNQVKILRTEAGKTSIFFADLTSEKALSSEGFYMHPNDVVMVGPLKSKKFAARGSQTFISFLSAFALVATVIVSLARK